MKPCSKCGGARETSHAYCRSCRAAYARRWRANGGETMSPADLLRARVRASTQRKLQRWGLRPVRCLVCGRPPFGRQPLECHHPTYEGRWASWIIVPIHPACHRRLHAGDSSFAEPIDLRDLPNIPPGIFASR